MACFKEWEDHAVTTYIVIPPVEIAEAAVMVENMEVAPEARKQRKAA